MTGKAKLRLHQGIKKERPDYAALHLNAFMRACEIYQQTHNKRDLLKTVNHGVRHCAALDRKQYDTDLLFRFYDSVMGFLKLITPRELMQIFPIQKSYDGERWGMRDYFSTMKELQKHSLDEPIGKNINELLWGYVNSTVSCFMASYMCVVSDLHQRETGNGLIETFFGIKPYTMHTDATTGKQYLYDGETGQSFKIIKHRPRWARVIKGGAR